jgi:isoaspartyl peptidase/L-asparaginase-like protein (Ntn-hydrolase superfamily)
MESGLTAHAAAIRAVEAASRRLRGEAGIIAIDRVGHVAAVHNTPLMPWAFSDARMKNPRARKNGKIVFPVRIVA